MPRKALTVIPKHFRRKKKATVVEPVKLPPRLVDILPEVEFIAHHMVGFRKHLANVAFRSDVASDVNVIDFSEDEFEMTKESYG